MRRRTGGGRDGKEDEKGGDGDGDTRQASYRTRTNSFKATSLLLFQLAFVPLVVFLFLEANIKVVLFGKLRLYNTVDFCVLTFFYSHVLESLLSMVFDRADRESTSFLSPYRAASTLVLVFQMGRILHCSADAIHSYATEIKDYSKDMPRDVLDLIHFLDEDMGHWILFASYFSLLSLLTAYYPTGHHSKERAPSPLLPLVSGLVMGATHAVAVIESSHWWFGVVGCFTMLAGCLLTSFSCRNPFLLFSSSASLSLLVCLILYKIAVGSFQEPSALGGVLHVAKKILTCAAGTWSLTLHC
uniref:Uncharacterized protein n=1 Tax=Guillardia theta TaxID=55529 RepID=A0A7S4JB05_GUITH|mmetsp:Transcript_14691/g.50155  ORF Transcript_14691/g.50155 Transcript_14691/m.50155 type:complete len:300 (+) Transcript_14691:40-939(+)